MFLVLLRCTSDELPLRLCHSRAVAQAVVDAYEDGDGQMAKFEELFHFDCSESVCLWIVEFDEDGKPVSAENVRELIDG